MSVLASCLSKHDKKIVIAICVPAKDQLHTKFAYCLTQLMLNAQQEGIVCKLFFSLGTLIVNQRESLVKDALEVGATHILWLDSDMIFPTNILDVLLKHNKDVIACNYSGRRLPLKSVAFRDAGNWESYLSGDSTGLVEVDAVGMGCMLVKTDFYKQLARPWFQLIWDEVVEDHHGEDMFHCKNIKSLGHKIWIDCDLSLSVKHLGDYSYDLKDINVL